MSHLARLLLLALLALLAWVIPGAVQARRAPVQLVSASTSAAPNPVLKAFVEPGYDIGIRDQVGDLRGRTIAAGTYTVEVYDYSTIHNFELKGDGVDVETDEEWTGRATWTVTFRSGGEYEFECDPHHDFMYGEFRAGNVAPPPPPPGPPPPPRPAGGTLRATVFTVTARAPKPPLEVSSLAVSKVRGQIVVRMRVSKAASAQIRVLRKSRALASVRAALKTGSNVKRLRLPARARRGLHRVQVTISDAGKRQVFTRAIRL